MNTLFKKEKLDEITYEHFEMAAYAAMTAGFESIGLGGYPAGEDFYLYGEKVNGHLQSVVSLNNWSGYLSLLVTDRKGLFLFYGHVDGLSAKQTIRVLYNQFLSVKDAVDTEAERAFPKQKIGMEAVRKFHDQWSEVEKRIREYVAENPTQIKEEYHGRN